MTQTFLTVRRARTSDLAELDQLFGRSYPHLLKADYLPSVMVTAVPRIARANPKLISSGRYFVVVGQSGALVGAGGWTASAPPGYAARQRVGHIRHVVTDSRRTRQGIGRTLMGKVVEDARASGIDTLDCLSTLTAEAFYAACGFHSLGPVTVPLGPSIDFPAIRMQRSL